VFVIVFVIVPFALCLSRGARIMASEAQVQALSRLLFAVPDMHVYAVLDGASVEGLLERFQRDRPEQICLYRGELERDLAEAAPYLVRLEPESDFAAWVVERGWGEHWGIFAVTDADMRALRQHFRRFLMVHDHSGKPLYFRYYDPRVLRTFLPTCNDKELKTIFGPVKRYLVESEDPNVLLRFSAGPDGLARDEVRLVRDTRAA
jgi:hypothetical protein